MNKEETLKRVEKFLDIVDNSDEATITITVKDGVVTSFEYTIVEVDKS